jgi:PRC-barrel domain
MTPPTTTPVIPITNLAEWKGQDVVDRDGDKLGTLVHVMYDNEVDEPAFAAIKSGALGRRLTYVPLTGSTAGRRYVKVAGTKAGFKDAPSFPTDAELTVEDEGQVYQYFKLDYSPLSEGVRRLARR